jgi:2-methylisocitrate lyase-like PEP mutase family enzyme/pimeloyl-ACP methyl ester carboxylesterase
MDLAKQRELASAFRARHRSKEMIVLPNAFDAASARVIAAHGPIAIGTTSAAIAWALGHRDGEHIERQRMLAAIELIVGAVEIGVTADIEAGYGDQPEDAAATAQSAIEIGAIGLNLEDTAHPLGAAAGPLLAAEQAVEKIAAVRSVADRQGIDLVNNARTDVFLLEAADEEERAGDAIDRGNRYLAAGADCVFVPGATTVEAIAQLVAGIDGPVSVYVAPDVPDVGELTRLGVARVSVGCGPYQACLALIDVATRELLEQGTYETFLKRHMPYPAVQELLSSQRSTMNSTSTEIAHEYAELNGVRLHYARAGEGPLMLFLHGFPQSWYMWRDQLREFAGEHLAVASDQRGYNLSSKPDGVHSYGVWPALQDARALVEHLGYERFVLVGHDWGSAVAWSFALHYPEMLDAVIVLGGAHPATLDRAFDEDAEQQQASQYLIEVRKPDIEAAVAAANYAVLEQALDFPFFDEADRAEYRGPWRIPGALTAALRWYQAEGIAPASEDGTPARGNFVPDIAPLIVKVPTLVIYPDADPYVRPGAHSGLDQYVPDLTFHTNQGGSHWIAEEHPQLVNQHIRAFIKPRVPATA